MPKYHTSLARIYSLIKTYDSFTEDFEEYMDIISKNAHEHTMVLTVVCEQRGSKYTHQIESVKYKVENFTKHLDMCGMDETQKAEWKLDYINRIVKGVIPDRYNTFFFIGGGYDPSCCIIPVTIINHGGRFEVEPTKFIWWSKKLGISIGQGTNLKKKDANEYLRLHLDDILGRLVAKGGRFGH